LNHILKKNPISEIKKYKVFIYISLLYSIHFYIKYNYIKKNIFTILLKKCIKIQESLDLSNVKHIEYREYNNVPIKMIIKNSTLPIIFMKIIIVTYIIFNE